MPPLTWVGYVACAMALCAALSPFAFAAHDWYKGWQWRRQMEKEWERDVQDARWWHGERRTNENGDTLH